MTAPLIKYSDLAEPIYDLWLGPLMKRLPGRDISSQAQADDTAVTREAHAFLLRWLNEQTLDLNTIPLDVQAFAMVMLFETHRAWGSDLSPISPNLWSLGPEGAARALVREEIRLHSSARGPVVPPRA
jgi:hypothetical protein